MKNKTISALILSALLCGCSSSDINAAVSYTECTNGVNTLTSAMLDVTEESTEGSKNGIISGFSAYSALAMIYPYTSETARSEIDNALGAISTEATEYARKSLPAECGSMFLIDDDTKLNTKKRSDFIFRDLQDSSIVDTVNSMAAKNTHGLIDKVIDAPYDTDARAVIIDTLYFRKDWQQKFSEENSFTDIFHGRTKDTNTEYMKNNSSYRVSGNMLQLQYADCNVVMDIIRDIDDASDAFDNYLKSHSALDNSDISENVELILPVFSAEGDYKIIDCFRSLGINEIFTEGTSSLPALADQLYISDAEQKVRTIVDEKGTEAAAVTVMEMKDAAIPEKTEFHVKEPFLYVIRDRDTDVILFAGYYFDME